MAKRLFIYYNGLFTNKNTTYRFIQFNKYGTPL